MHCDHTVHFSANLSLRLDSPMFWAPNIYDDIVFTMVSVSLSSVTLTFDLKLISTTKPNTSVTKIGWKCFYWFVRYGVVRLTWPWPSTFDPKAKHHIYEPTYNYGQNWVKFPSLFLKIWRLQGFRVIAGCDFDGWLFDLISVSHALVHAWPNFGEI